jgi:hypothetical protein
MNEAVDKKLTTNTEYKSRRFKKVSEEVENIYLTQDELSKIYKKDLTKAVVLKIGSQNYLANLKLLPKKRALLPNCSSIRNN